MRIDRNRKIAPYGPARTVARTLMWESPELPRQSGRGVKRLRDTATWTTPGTLVLVRHRGPDGRRIVSLDRTPPRGFEIEFDLGLVHPHGVPGTHRLIASADNFITTSVAGQTGRNYTDLGYVETHALPMLDALEVRRVPETGQLTLVSGAADPLFHVAEHVETVGFVDSYPVQPRDTLDIRQRRLTMLLTRRMDAAAGRHRYAAGAAPASGSVEIAVVQAEPADGLIALKVDTRGRVTSELMKSKPAPRTPARVARWIAAPLRWEGRTVPPQWAMRAAVGRVRRLPAMLSAPRAADGDQPTLGYIYERAADDLTPLYSATHPVVRDQFLTCSELEAHDLGYRVDGILGYVPAPKLGRPTGGPQDEIKWATRFGRRRRYALGPA